MRKRKLVAGVGLVASLVVGITLFAAWWSRDSFNGVMEAEEGLDSPLLAALAKELEEGNSASLDRFWGELDRKTPLIEPIAGQEGFCWVSFIWRGAQDTRRVAMMGGPAAEEPMKRLTRMRRTDLWYRTERIPNDARFVYWFQVNGPPRWPMEPAKEDEIMKKCPLRTDPLNGRTAVGWPPGSLAELPKAPPEIWLKRAEGVAKGKVQERRIASAILGGKQERVFEVYTPAEFESRREACGTVVLFDGATFNTPEIPGPVILDNLIAKKKIAPMVAVMVHQTDQRNQEVNCSESFADFVAQELVPWLVKEYRLKARADRTIVGGFSAGGLMGAYCAFRHPEVFGNVLSMSGSFAWYPGMWEGKLRLDAEPWLTQQYMGATPKPVRFFLTAGRFENTPIYNLLGENRHFRDVLLAKGYRVSYREFNGGHDPCGWRGKFVEGLMTLAGE